jgi:hypothetical protein
VGAAVIKPDTDGFRDAQRRLRQELGAAATFYMRSPATWAPDEPIDPDTGRPFDPFAEPASGGEDREVVKLVSYVARPLTSGRALGGDSAAAPIGNVDMTTAAVIVDVDDYPEVKDAHRVKVADTVYDVEMWPLDKNYVAIGFNFDDGGELIEMGSDLIQRTYTIEVWAVGTEPVAGRNLANTIRDIAEAENIPLRDYRQPGTPIIDYLQVDPVQVHRQPVQDPKPWQENLWIVHVPVVDCYYASES